MNFQCNTSHNVDCNIDSKSEAQGLESEISGVNGQPQQHLGESDREEEESSRMMKQKTYHFPILRVSQKRKRAMLYPINGSR